MVMAIINAIIMESTGRKAGAGPIGLILMFAFFAGARAIWKYNPDKENNSSSNDKHHLDKK